MGQNPDPGAEESEEIKRFKESNAYIYPGSQVTVGGGPMAAGSAVFSDVAETTLNGSLLRHPESSHMKLYNVDIEVTEISVDGEVVEQWVHITQPEHNG